MDVDDVHGSSIIASFTADVEGSAVRELRSIVNIKEISVCIKIDDCSFINNILTANRINTNHHHIRKIGFGLSTFRNGHGPPVAAFLIIVDDSSNCIIASVNNDFARIFNQAAIPNLADCG